jgi:thiosulfate/3-mercaptopyruvate sulfurtransferase
MNNLISVEQLKGIINDSNLILLDASLPKPVQGEASEFQNMGIPSARYFDLKGKFSDKDSKFPNTLPPEAQFEREAQKLGISSDSKIVVYDNLGIYSSPRVWWMFKVMGHDNIAVLNGGLPEWTKAGGELVELNKEEVYEKGDFKASLQSEFVKSYQDILKNIENPSFTIVDARSSGRFEGTAPDPRKHLQSGHIPNSINIPFQELLEDGKFKSKTELKVIFAERYKTDQQLVFSCGSGLTACIVMLATEIAYQKSPYLYDGSWTEFAELQGLINQTD